MNKIVVVDYGMGNLRSVANAVEALGHEVFIAHRPETIASAERVIVLQGGKVTQDLRRVPAARGEAHRLHEHLKVFPRFFLRGRRSEQVRRVVSDDGGDAFVAVPAPWEPADRECRVEERGGGDFSEQAKKIGPDDRDLAHQEQVLARKVAAIEITGPVKRRYNNTLRGLEHLPITLTPA